jgi:serine/threonine protein phosphatase PrpC
VCVPLRNCARSHLVFLLLHPIRRSGADSTVSGTTAILVFFNGLQYVCANLGDSRAMISRGPAPPGPPYAAASAARLTSKALSNDHKPSRPDEKARIQKTSAKILSESALGISGGDPSKLYVCRVHEGEQE